MAHYNTNGIYKCDWTGMGMGRACFAECYNSNIGMTSLSLFRYTENYTCTNSSPECDRTYAELEVICDGQGGHGNSQCDAMVTGPCLNPAAGCSDHEYEMYCCYYNCGGSWCANYQCPAAGSGGGSGISNARRSIAPRGGGGRRVRRKQSPNKYMNRGGRVRPNRMRRGGSLGNKKPSNR